jgi:hypothetical protein
MGLKPIDSPQKNPQGSHLAGFLFAILLIAAFAGYQTAGALKHLKISNQSVDLLAELKHHGRIAQEVQLR